MTFRVDSRSDLRIPNSNFQETTATLDTKNQVHKNRIMEEAKSEIYTFNRKWNAQQRRRDKEKADAEKEEEARRALEAEIDAMRSIERARSAEAERGELRDRNVRHLPTARHESLHLFWGIAPS